MHALDWIRREGKCLRRVTAQRLRSVLQRGKRQCTWCGSQVPKGRRNWCGPACVDDFQSIQPANCAALAFRRDRGICQLCHKDLIRIDSLLLKLQHGPHADHDAWHTYLQHLQGLGFRMNAALWLADHIVPVCKGGGLCDVNGYRVLCLPCHERITRELNQELHKAKRVQRRRSQANKRESES